MRHERAVCADLRGEADNLVGEHLRVGRGGEGAFGIVGEACGGARVRPDAAVEHQMAADVAHAVVAQLRLHFQQLGHVEHGVAAACPIQIAVEQAAAQRGGGFELGLPAEIPAEGAQGGVGGYQFHGGGGVERHVGAVFGQHFAAAQVLHEKRHFVRPYLPQIRGGGGQGEEEAEEGEQAAGHGGGRVALAEGGIIRDRPSESAASARPQAVCRLARYFQTAYCLVSGFSGG